MLLVKNYTECGCGYAELCKPDGIVLLTGDDYHHKIDSRIIGYTQALTDNKIQYEVIFKKIKCPYCDE